MKKSRISRFVIKDLYGYQNVDIQFDERCKILIGENGIGKTTVLNCLYYLLSKKFDKLNRIQFSSMELVFANKTRICFAKSDLNYFIERPKKYKRSHFYDVLMTNISEENISALKEIVEAKTPEQVKRIKTVEFLNGIGVKINAPSSYIFDNINKFITEFEALDFLRVIEKIEKEISSKILYFPTYRRIEEELKNIGKFPKAEVMEKYGEYLDEDEMESLNKDIASEEDDIIQFGMADVDEKIFEITQSIIRSSMIGFSQITGELLSQLLKGFPNKISRNSLKDLDKIQIILERVGDNISQEDKINIMDFVKSGQTTNKELIYFLYKLTELYNKQEKLDTSIKKFAEVCNGYLVGKKYHYNESEVSLNIFREKSNEIVSLNQLSSGEKQIVSLFSKIYLDQEQDFIVLFDEPELSLSIFWQKRLLPDIMASGKCKFLLAVTHSPFIFENDLRPFAVGLNEYIKFQS